MERKIFHNKCLDLNLMSEDTIDFYLISSKDNIIISVNNVITCYTRDDVKNEAMIFGQYIYFNKDSALKNVILNKTDYNRLINRKYDIYDLVDTNKIVKNKKLMSVVGFKITDLLE